MMLRLNEHLKTHPTFRSLRHGFMRATSYQLTHFGLVEYDLHRLLLDVIKLRITNSNVSGRD